MTSLSCFGELNDSKNNFCRVFNFSLANFSIPRVTNMSRSYFLCLFLLNLQSWLINAASSGHVDWLCISHVCSFGEEFSSRDGTSCVMTVTRNCQKFEKRQCMCDSLNATYDFVRQRTNSSLLSVKHTIFDCSSTTKTSGGSDAWFNSLHKTQNSKLKILLKLRSNLSITTWHTQNSGIECSNTGIVRLGARSIAYLPYTIKHITSYIINSFWRWHNMLASKLAHVWKRTDLLTSSKTSYYNSRFNKNQKFHHIHFRFTRQHFHYYKSLLNESKIRVVINFKFKTSVSPFKSQSNKRPSLSLLLWLLDTTITS